MFINIKGFTIRDNFIFWITTYVSHKLKKMFFSNTKYKMVYHNFSSILLLIIIFNRGKYEGNFYFYFHFCYII